MHIISDFIIFNSDIQRESVPKYFAEECVCHCYIGTLGKFLAGNTAVKYSDSSKLVTSAPIQMNWGLM